MQIEDLSETLGSGPFVADALKTLDGELDDLDHNPDLRDLPLLPLIHRAAAQRPCRRDASRRLPEAISYRH